MNKSKTKKADMSINVVIMAALGILVLIMIIIVFKNQISKGNNELNNQFVGLQGDCDGDGAVNSLDRCCNCNTAGDNIGVNGCIGDETEEQLKACRSCPKDANKCNAKS